MHADTLWIALSLRVEIILIVRFLNILNRAKQLLHVGVGKTSFPMGGGASIRKYIIPGRIALSLRVEITAVVSTTPSISAAKFKPFTSFGEKDTHGILFSSYIWFSSITCVFK